VRLVPLLLSAALVGLARPGAAQVRPARPATGKLPWDLAPSVPWTAGDCGAPQAMPVATPEAGPLRVRVTLDGALRITNGRGLILLRTGLPGRPLRLWRSAGRILDWRGPVRFPMESPLTRGIGGLPVGAADFRPSLTGLLWILCDDEKVLTVVHPVTARLCYLPLPGGSHFQLYFFPDRLEVRQQVTGARPTEECWSLPWLSLLPQLVQLGLENPANRPSGTALLPFPKS